MLIKRRSMFTGIEREMDLPITEEEYARWKGGELVQTVWPHLTDDQREFLMTGATPEEWDHFLGDSDEE